MALNTQEQRLFAYLNAEMDAGERTAFEREIRSSARLTKEVEDLQRLLTQLDQMAVFSPSPDFRPRVVAAALQAWEKRLDECLGQLPELAPKPDFAEQVMAKVALASTPAKAPSVLAARLRALVRRRRSEPIAIASGLTIGPTVAVAGAAFLVLRNHPLLTLQNIASFLRLKVTELFGRAADALSGGPDGGALSLLDGFAGATPTVLAGLLLVVGLSLASGWVLYSNVVKFSGNAEVTRIHDKDRYVPA